MSEAATQLLSPRRKTAQSSPMGTRTSGGAGGRKPGRRRIASNSLTALGGRRGGAGRGTSGSGETARARGRRPRARRRSRRRRGARRSPRAYDRRRWGERPRPRPKPTTTPRPPAAPRLRPSPGRSSDGPPVRPLCAGPRSRSSGHAPDLGPQPVRVPGRVPGPQGPPLILRRPQVVVVGRVFQPDLPTGVPGQKTDPGVQLGVVRGLPGLDPSPPREQGTFYLQPRLLASLAAGAPPQDPTRLEDAAA